MNIYLHELRAYRKSTIIWTIALIGVIAMFISFLPIILKEADAFKPIILGIPLPVRKAMGFDNIEKLFTIIGFYSAEFQYITLLGAIQAMNFGVSIISKETRDKTADFLMTKPVSRTKILTSKLLAVLTSIVFTNICYLTVVFILTSLVSKTPPHSQELFMVSITLFFVQLIFLSIGSLLSVIFSNIKSVLAVSLGTVFALYFIALFDNIIGKQAARYITPFKYFDATYIIKNLSYEISYLMTGFIIVTICVIASYLFYNKKDIPSV